MKKTAAKKKTRKATSALSTARDFRYNLGAQKKGQKTKRVAAKPAEPSKRKAKRKPKAAARTVRAAKRPTIIKKVIQGADAQALKILVEGVKRHYLEGTKVFEHRVARCPPEVQTRARHLLQTLGATPVTAGALAILVAELEHEKHAPKRPRRGIAVAAENIGKDDMATIDMETGIMRKDHASVPVADTASA